MMQVATGLGMLGRIQVTPRWVNDPVWRHDGLKVRKGRGMIRYLPWVDIGWRSEKGGAGIIIIAI